MKRSDRFQIFLFILAAISVTTIFFYFSTTPHHGNYSEDYPTAQDGVLDLRGWDFSQHGPVPLDGQWEFFPDSLLFPSDDFSDPSYVKVPSRWSQIESMGRYGYATYRLNVLLDPGEELFGFENASVSTAFRLFVNGSSVLEVGKVGKSEATSEPMYSPQTTPLHEFEGEEEYEIILQVSNYDYRTGGLWRQFWFGPFETLITWKWLLEARSSILFGSLIVMAFFFAGLYIMRRYDRYYLYLALLSFLLACRSLFPVQYIISNFFPSIPFDIMVRMEYLTLYLALAASALFFRELYPLIFSKRHRQVIVYVPLLFSLFVLILPPSLFTYSVYPFYLFSLYAMVYMASVIIRAVMHHVSGSLLMLSGSLILAAAVINDYFYLTFSSKTGTFIELGMIFFIFFQALALSLRLTEVFSEVNELSDSLTHLNMNLEEEIERRAEELRIANESMQNLEEIRVAEEERKRVGRNLHDTLGQSVHALELLGESLRLRGDVPHELQGKIEGMLHLNSEIKRNLYTILGELYPVGVGPRGLLAAVERFTGNMMAIYDLSIDIICPVRDMPLEEACADDVYHIVSEGIMNALRHASPGRIEVSLLYSQELLTIRVVNDGVGKNPPVPERKIKSGGHGLSIMSYRAKVHGGLFTYENSGDGNYTIEARIPVAHGEDRQ